MWDESRFAVNALELLKTKNPVVQYYNGIPDLWNTKPPLTTWLMAIFMKFLGYNELAVRLTSALAGTITALVIFRFIRKQTGTLFTAFLCGMVFITSIGFIGAHVARTGDADALAVLFLTLFAFSFYEMIMGNKKEQLRSSRKFYVTAIFLGLALMTKSSYCLILFPGIIILVFLFREQGLFSNRHLYFSFILSILPFLIYLISREHENPGYLNAVIKNDFLNRYANSLEEHHHPFFYYFTEMARRRFFPWLYFLPLSLVAYLKTKNENEKNILVFSFVMSLSILLFISISQTKTEWYDAAFYPFAAILVGIGIKETFVYIADYLNFKKSAHQRIIYIFCFLAVFYMPVRKVLSYADIKPWAADFYQLKYGAFMKKKYASNFSSPVKYFEPEYNSHLLFYVEVYQLQNKNATIIKDWNEIVKDEFIATCTPSLKMEIEKRFETSIYFKDEYCSCYKILDNKM